MATPGGPITQILTDLAGGDAEAADRLWPLVYEDLRAIAGSHFRGRGGGHTLQPTALAHEAYLRLVGKEGDAFSGRAHFLAVAAKAMRQILINHARDKTAAKRGGGWDRVTIDQATPVTDEEVVDVLALDDAMTALAELSERQAHVVELRFFGGLTIQETALVLDVGTTTVEDDWALARAWLRKRLRPEAGS